MPKKKQPEALKEEAQEEIKEEVAKEEVKEKIIGTLLRDRVIADSTNASREFYDKSRFGAPMEANKIQYSLAEALYLLEKGRMEIHDKGKLLTFHDFVKKANKVEGNFWVRYCAFRDFRNRGYIIKTALKFGADFRVYDRGVKPGEDHAKWIVYPVHEGDRLTWYEFAAKNRVAHSTRKRLLIAIVDEESSVTYYEVAWKRP
ncbi:tRNA-intron lyase [Candidatus Woesearchaeota archaeon]|nr:tRNA-intron lyase [Candidatus Woesearchaeota archaeon]